MVVISVDSASELGVQGLGDETHSMGCSENSDNLQTQPSANLCSFFFSVLFQITNGFKGDLKLVFSIQITTSLTEFLISKEVYW